MKIIDLLNKIANGEEVPKEIYFKKQWWKYNPDNDYEGTDWGGCFLNYVLINELNEEVEIIEEDKKIEKFKDYIPIGLTSVGADFIKKDVFEALLKIGDKINEIIDYINKGD